MLGQRDYARQLMAQTLYLLPQIEVVRYLVFLLKYNRVVIFFTLLQFLQTQIRIQNLKKICFKCASKKVVITFTQGGNVGIVLKLKKRTLQHKLGIDAFDPEQVEHHVVGEMKRAVQRIGLALDNVLGRGRTHPLVNHQYNNALVVKTASSGTTAHLNIFARCDPANVFAVPFAARGEQHCARGHVQAHRECLGGEQHFQQTLGEQDLNGLLEHGQHA